MLPSFCFGGYLIMKKVFCIPEIIGLLYNVFILYLHFLAADHNIAIHARKILSNFFHIQTDADAFMLAIIAPHQN